MPAYAAKQTETRLFRPRPPPSHLPAASSPAQKRASKGNKKTDSRKHDRLFCPHNFTLNPPKRKIGKKKEKALKI
jgi:hypothetical protein